MTNVATRFQPDISGSAVPSGFVGEIKTSIVSSNTAWPLATATYGDIATLTLSAGIWEVSAQIIIIRNGASIANPSFISFIGLTSGNSSAEQSMANGRNDSVQTWRDDFSVVSTFIIPIRVLSDGTNLTLPSGATAATQVVRLKGYLAPFSVATPQHQYLFKAVRIL